MVKPWEERVEKTGQEMSWPHEWTVAMQAEITELRAVVQSTTSRNCDSTKPIESDYVSHVAYCRALEEYCDIVVANYDDELIAVKKFWQDKVTAMVVDRDAVVDSTMKAAS
jgi:hypothetical protein